jgi:hypothetical protein
VGILEQPLDRPLSIVVHDGRLQAKAEGKLFATKVWLRQVPNYRCLLRALDVMSAR